MRTIRQIVPFAIVAIAITFASAPAHAQEARGSGPFTNVTQGTVVPTLQGAIDAANNGDVIAFPAGVIGNVGFAGIVDGKDLTIRGADPNTPDASVWFVTGTGSGILAINGANLTVRTIQFIESSSPSVQADGASSLVVEDCTFLLGTGDTGLIVSVMATNTPEVTVTRCTFDLFIRPLIYTAIRASDVSVLNVRDSVFETTDNQGEGGGIRTSTSGPQHMEAHVVGCTFTQLDVAVNFFAGDQTSIFDITDCTMSDNVQHLNTLFVPVTITNSVFAGTGGIGISSPPSSVSISNCTFADFAGTGFNFTVQGDANIANSIFWGGTPSLNLTGAANTVEHTLFQGGFAGTGNIDADPMFVDALGADGLPGTGDEDFRLRPGSPCLDAGSNLLVNADAVDLDGDLDITEPVPFDIAGGLRFKDDADTIDTGIPGNGFTQVVDMGAHEGVPCPGDATGDGFANLDDLQILLFQFGSSVPPFTGGDFTGDGIVNLDDLQLLLFTFGTSCPA